VGRDLLEPVGAGEPTIAGIVRNDLEAVLFDMDGTLVETEEYWGEAMFALAEQLGGEMSPEARERTVGTSMRFTMEVLYDDLGLSVDERQLRADARWVEERTAQLMAEGGIRWQPGARELVVAVREAELAAALVTTTPRHIAAIVLRRIAEDLGGEPFDLTICGDEVPARKPDPAPYRLALEALSVDPENAVVIEDSLAGVTAGLAAGCAVLGVPRLQPVPPAPGLVLRESLAGADVLDLAGVLAARSEVPAA
jgi:HAD superfamily hydrolase (TIGR01509 family)